MREVDQKEMAEIRETVYDYFAEECEIDKSEIRDDTDIMEELEGDSLMLLSLLEIFRKKYNLTIELKALGKHLMKKPANTVGQVIDLTTQIVRHGDDILAVSL
ncbi:MAG: acyl carrier protein [Chitinivibrionales bacterium]|nr:acyl carrier protein [Chitinivibrionales bacterium]